MLFLFTFTFTSFLQAVVSQLPRQKAAWPTLCVCRIRYDAEPANPLHMCFYFFNPRWQEKISFQVPPLSTLKKSSLKLFYLIPVMFWYIMFCLWYIPVPCIHTIFTKYSLINWYCKGCIFVICYVLIVHGQCLTDFVAILKHKQFNSPSRITINKNILLRNKRTYFTNHNLSKVFESYWKVFNNSKGHLRFVEMTNRQFVMVFIVLIKG